MDISNGMVTSAMAELYPPATEEDIGNSCNYRSFSNVCVITNPESVNSGPARLRIRWARILDPRRAQTDFGPERDGQGAPGAVFFGRGLLGSAPRSATRGRQQRLVDQLLAEQLLDFTGIARASETRVAGSDDAERQDHIAGPARSPACSA